MSKLNVLKAKALQKPGTYGDGSGLYLQVRSPDNRSWLFRFKLHGRSHLMGLGHFRDVPLAEARDRAASARRLVRQGINPIQERRSQRAEAAAKAGEHDFQTVAQEYIAAQTPGWSSPIHRQQWRNTMRDHVYGCIGRIPVGLVDTDAVLSVLKPIWTTRPETASRIRGRIESVLSYAKARGWRTGENPARWKGHLDHALPPVGRKQQDHHPALAWQRVPAFWSELSDRKGVTALALRFTILTACRTGEVVDARWCEIDTQAAVWTIPASRMKAKVEHCVPLSDAALAVLEAVKPVSGDEFIFLGGKIGKPLGHMAMLTLIKKMDSSITVHGFRSSFRDWVAEAVHKLDDTSDALIFTRDVAEACLAHTLASKVEASYQRGTMLEKRRKLMQAWAEYVVTPERIAERDC